MVRPNWARITMSSKAWGRWARPWRRRLLEAGAQVSGYDPDRERMQLMEAQGLSPLSEEALFRHPCDVFMPCALGGVIDLERAKEAPWRGVCGSANNQLSEAKAARVLHERGILWAPDFVVNAGAVIEGVHTVRGAEDPKAARNVVAMDIERIRARCASILRASRDRDRDADTIAKERARRALEAGEHEDFEA